MNRMTDLERDIEESRARLDHTIDRLQDRMNASGVADDVLGTARRYGWGPELDRAAEAIRENPIPVLLVAAGIGWLALSMTSASRRRAAREDLKRRGVWDRPPRRHVSGDPALRDGDIDPAARVRPVPADMLRTESPTTTGRPPVEPVTPERPAPYAPVAGSASGARR
ncbi:DUF3618 domain-containing protein [Salinarimonas chemoclinalis]|uniref:DUF3618 domain-containing protein n=1 Tax=Salinarimonas chemoclinalis TaxID=3241599 RepID=UPI0035584EFF